MSGFLKGLLAEIFNLSKHHSIIWKWNGFYEIPYAWYGSKAQVKFAALFDLKDNEDKYLSRGLFDCSYKVRSRVCIKTKSERKFNILIINSNVSIRIYKN